MNDEVEVPASDAGPVLFEIPPECMGPAMLALRTDKQRRFAFIMGCGESNATQAYRAAGYEGNPQTERGVANYLTHRPNIAEAVKEVALKVLIGLAPVSVQALKRVLENPKHPKHVEVAQDILERTGFGRKSEHKLIVEHQDDSRMLEFAKKLAEEMGVESQKLIGRIDGALIEQEPAFKHVIDKEGNKVPTSRGKWILTPPGQAND